MPTIIDEVFQEVYESSDCHHSACGCHKCKQTQQEDEFEMIQTEIQKLGLELSTEEELEFGKAIAKLKALATKGYRKAKPLIVIGDIIRRILTPSPDFKEPPEKPPVEIVTKDTARFYEEERRRKREAAMQQAALEKKNKIIGKPDPEVSVLQEIFMEMEGPPARPTLRYGATGIHAVYLQKRLNYHNASIIPLKEDGIWGPKTNAAVLFFQKIKKIKMDGIVGPVTWGKLDEQASAPPYYPPAVCHLPQRQTEFELLELEAPSPALIKPAARACCMLAPNPGFGQPNFVDPANLGTHNGPNEATGPIYTGKAGFIDLGHVRDLCDLTKFVYEQMQAGAGYNSPIQTAHGEALLTVCPKDELKTARKICYHDSVGYEIITYTHNSPGGHNSSFSPEDLCSNNLGTYIAEKAINSILQSPGGKTFNGEVTKILPDVLKLLDAQSPAESQKAFDLVNGRWVSYSGSRSLLANSYLKRRNFTHLPWKAGHKSDGPTPSWLTDDPLLTRLHTYTNKLDRTIRDRDFHGEIVNIRTDAQSKYGNDYDKP
jgi:peptidoglycan hydrolase-like protein with peptidoglycan-binding domain